jgi:hypothetical protein
MKTGPGRIGHYPLWFDDQGKEIMLLNGDLSLMREIPPKRPLKQLPASKVQHQIQTKEQEL